jgi:hypothetical protein
MAFARISSLSSSRLLETRPDPLQALRTTALVAARMRHVTIDVHRIQSTAKVLSLRPLELPAWNYEYHFFDGTERTLVYLFLLDALNFSFWGTPRWTINYRGARLDGYWALAASLKRAAEVQPDLLDPAFLASISPEDLSRVLRGHGEIPMFAERWRNVRELGRVLSDRFGGSAARVVEGAGRDAPGLADTIASNFSSFRDTTVYDSLAVNLYKRAQILVADISGSFAGQGWGEFRNLGELTAFADYKLPQILRTWGIIKYDAGLARRVDGGVELTKDCPEEVEIRAATLWAVEFLREAMSQKGQALTSNQVDWFLWNKSHSSAVKMKPYHRVRTIYY